MFSISLAVEGVDLLCIVVGTSTLVGTNSVSEKEKGVIAGTPTTDRWPYLHSWVAATA